MAELEKNITDEQIAQFTIFGKGENPLKTPVDPSDLPPEDPVDPLVDSEPPADPVDPPPVEPLKPEDPPVDPTDPTDPVDPPEVPVEIDIEALSDDKALELINKKLNTNFDNIDAAASFASTQTRKIGQDQIIAQLVGKVKENANVLSHYPNEKFYQVAKLAEEYPGKEETLAKVVNTEIDSLSDFDAIELSEKLNRPAGSRANPLTLKLARLGLKDENPADFETWDAVDKELVIGEAEDARVSLKAIQNKIEIPKQEEGVVPDFVADIERGVQQSAIQLQERKDASQPIAEGLVNKMVKINPVEGSDFEFAIELSPEDKKDLTDFLVDESITGTYDIKADADIRKLNGMLESEIWATEGKKILTAYGKHVEAKTWVDADKKFNNEVPLDEDQPPAPAKDLKKPDDEERAQKLLKGE